MLLVEILSMPARKLIFAKREAATRLGNYLLRDGLIFPVCDDAPFKAPFAVSIL